MPDEREQFESHRNRVREELRRPGKSRDKVRVAGESYDVVGTEERVDKEWENDEADRLAQAWDLTRDDRLRDRMASRKQMTAGDRLDHAMRQIGLRLGGMRSRSIEAMRGGGGGKSKSKAPTPAGDWTRDMEDHLKLIAHHVEAIERELDEQDGLRLAPAEGDRPGNAGGYGASRMMTTAERDRIVWEDFQGVRAEVVASEAPYLGSSARTIERARVNEAERRQLRVRQVDGVILGPAEPVRQAA